MSNSQIKKDTLVFIPAYNESNNIAKVIEEVGLSLPGVDILVVDDGSLDNTAEVVSKNQVFLVRHLFNLGIGASFETGCKFAINHGYEYLLRIDADGQHRSDFLPKLMEAVKAADADIVIGSRFLGNSEFKSSILRVSGIYLISFLLKAITGRRATDPTSGFYAMNKKAFRFFSENCADDYPEPQILLYHRDFRIKEIPVLMSRRYSGASSITPIKSVFYMLKVALALLAVDPKRRKK